MIPSSLSLSSRCFVFFLISQPSGSNLLPVLFVGRGRLAAATKDWIGFSCSGLGRIIFGGARKQALCSTEKPTSLIFFFSPAPFLPVCCFSPLRIPEIFYCLAAPPVPFWRRLHGTPIRSFPTNDRSTVHGHARCTRRAELTQAEHRRAPGTGSADVMTGQPCGARPAPGLLGGGRGFGSGRCGRSSDVLGLVRTE